MNRKSVTFLKTGVWMAWLCILFSSILTAQNRTQLKPGWNLYSVEQDVEIGREVSVAAEKEVQLLNDKKVDAYLNKMVKELAAKAPGAQYPYQVKAVNDLTINAFALPGGYLYFNRGVIESAQSEAQLAGVIGHEVGHVALRHGTNQASKASFAQMGLAVLGGVMGENSIKGAVAQLLAGGLANSVLLKYSRTAENQADIAATHILYDTNYDPRAMIQFFEILEQKSGKSSGGKVTQWLSTHPTIENRMKNIANEVDLMGGPPSRYRSDSSDFKSIQRYIKGLAPPKEMPKKAGAQSGGGTGQERPEPPSTRLSRYENRTIQLRYPQNWKINEQKNSTSIAPEAGWIADQRGQVSLAYGLILTIESLDQTIQSTRDLEKVTQGLIKDLQQGNPKMQVTRSGQSIRAGQERALATWLSNESPLGGNEKIWLITIPAGNQLVYLVCVAPESDFESYYPSYQNIVDSVSLP